MCVVCGGRERLSASESFSLMPESDAALREIERLREEEIARRAEAQREADEARALQRQQYMAAEEEPEPVAPVAPPSAAPIAPPAAPAYAASAATYFEPTSSAPIPAAPTASATSTSPSAHAESTPAAPAYAASEAPAHHPVRLARRARRAGIGRGAEFRAARDRARERREDRRAAAESRRGERESRPARTLSYRASRALNVLKIVALVLILSALTAVLVIRCLEYRANPVTAFGYSSIICAYVVSAISVCILFLGKKRVGALQLGVANSVFAAFTVICLGAVIGLFNSGEESESVNVAATNLLSISISCSVVVAFFALIGSIKAFVVRSPLVGVSGIFFILGSLGLLFSYVFMVTSTSDRSLFYLGFGIALSLITIGILLTAVHGMRLSPSTKEDASNITMMLLSGLSFAGLMAYAFGQDFGWAGLPFHTCIAVMATVFAAFSCKRAYRHRENFVYYFLFAVANVMLAVAEGLDVFDARSCETQLLCAAGATFGFTLFKSIDTLFYLNYNKAFSVASAFAITVANAALTGVYLEDYAAIGCAMSVATAVYLISTGVMVVKEFSVADGTSYIVLAAAHLAFAIAMPVLFDMDASIYQWQFAIGAICPVAFGAIVCLLSDELRRKFVLAAGLLALTAAGCCLQGLYSMGLTELALMLSSIGFASAIALCFATRYVTRVGVAFLGLANLASIIMYIVRAMGLL